MKKFIQSFLLTVTFLLYTGCGSTSDELFNLNVHEEAYILNLNYSTHAEPQFASNYFLPLETRDIIVKGFFKESEAPNYKSVTISGPGITALSSQIGNAPNQYVEKVTLSDNSKAYKFVVPITVTAPPSTGFYDAQINPFSVSFPLQINVGLNRSYDIFYSAMIDYDLRLSGYNFTENLSEAFNECNTEINLNVGSLNMVNEDLPYSILTSDWIYQTHQFFRNRGVLPNEPQLYSVYLYGCKNINLGSVQLSILGYTMPKLPSQINDHRLSIILVERIRNSISGDTQQRKYITYCTIHELGHARGMALTTGAGYFDGDITDGNHTGGHNGTFKRYCLMRIRNNPNDPDFNEDNFLQAIDNPRFCKGHLNILFNVEW